MSCQSCQHGLFHHIRFEWRRRNGALEQIRISTPCTAEGCKCHGFKKEEKEEEETVGQ